MNALVAVASILWPKVAPPMALPPIYKRKIVIDMPDGFDEKVVALTFDDGPSPLTTPRILNALNAHRAKATFYVVGGMLRQRGALLRDIASYGHEIGNHSMSHRARMSPGEAVVEVDKTTARIVASTGYVPNTYRPPYGIQNNPTTIYAQKQGFPIIIWTGDSLDWKIRNADSVYSRAMASLKPGAVILMHDIHEHTARAVPSILASIEKRGYKCITMTDMLTRWNKFELAQKAKKAASLQAQPKGQPQPTPTRK